MTSTDTKAHDFGALDATPADPILASHLTSDEELDKVLEGVHNDGFRKQKERLETGVKNLDDALSGGIVAGRVVGISGDVGKGASEVCRTLLISSLFEYEGSTAAVIDTTGNFDILRLYSLIVSKMKQCPDVLDSLHASGSVEDVAAQVLDRVKIMRVFDFVGVREAVGEIREQLEGRKGVEQMEMKEVEVPVEEVKPKRTYVADSEDEEDDEEMLFDTEATLTTSAPPVHEPEPKPATEPRTTETETAEAGRLKFLLIDSLAQVLNPLLKKDHIQAMNLATAFLPTITHLTRAHGLHTILINPTITPRAPSPVQQAPNAPTRQHQEPPPPPSLFSSNLAIPNLMNLLGRYTDMELLVSSLPRRKMDAKVFYSDSGAGKGMSGKRGVEMVGVLEVVGERWEGGVGGWGVFREDEGGVRAVE